jgi:hypothetical protein
MESGFVTDRFDLRRAESIEVDHFSANRLVKLPLAWHARKTAQRLNMVEWRRFERASDESLPD